jgi:predicted transcriptional regulator of viral defense system/very-short-patch-repair endonuclease
VGATIGGMRLGGPKTRPCGTESDHLRPAERRESAIQRLAARQHGVVALRQLETLGLGASGVRRRVVTGKLRRLHHGVYAVGLAAPTVKAAYMAAVLACGPGAALSYRSAGAHLGLRACSRSTVDVSTPRRTGKGRPGIQVHRAARLEPCDVTDVEGIPCTTVARTLLDLAGTIDGGALERAVERAEELQVFDLRAVEDVLARAGRHGGARALRAVLGAYTPEPEFTRSRLERRFLEVCRRAGVPRPQVNRFSAVPGDGFEVDFTWPDQRLMVEVDSHRYHGSRAAFERDRRRDQKLIAAGWRVVRFTWRQVFGQPDEVAATLRALLGCLFEPRGPRPDQGPPSPVPS